MHQTVTAQVPIKHLNYKGETGSACMSSQRWKQMGFASLWKKMWIHCLLPVSTNTIIIVSSLIFPVSYLLAWVTINLELSSLIIFKVFSRHIELVNSALNCSHMTDNSISQGWLRYYTFSFTVILTIEFCKDRSYILHSVPPVYITKGISHTKHSLHFQLVNLKYSR